MLAVSKPLSGLPSQYFPVASCRGVCLSSSLLGPHGFHCSVEGAASERALASSLAETGAVGRLSPMPALIGSGSFVESDQAGWLTMFFLSVLLLGVWMAELGHLSALRFLSGSGPQQLGSCGCRGERGGLVRRPGEGGQHASRRSRQPLGARKKGHFYKRGFWCERLPLGASAGLLRGKALRFATRYLMKMTYGQKKKLGLDLFSRLQEQLSA